MAPLSVLDAAAERPDAIALVTPRETVRYAELASRATAMLRALERVGPGPIAFVARPSAATVTLIAALLERGRPFVPLHPRWTEAERRSALEHLDGSRAFNDRIVLVDPAELAADAGARGDAPAPGATPGRGEIAACLFTSGSAGAPKVVLLPHAALEASARAHAMNLPFVEHDRWLALMPLAHAGGLSILTRALASRTAVVLAERFDPAEVISTITRDRVTLASFVPAMLAALLDAGGEPALASLRACLIGGAGFPRGLRARARRAGVRALATYGLTETASQVATQRPDDPSGDDPALVGSPLPGVEVEIRDARGRPVEPGVPGRIWVRGPMVMRGYAGGPRLAPDDWLDTRDLGSLDERGALRVFGRADDTIITGGENVHPLEVEAVITQVRGVKEAAVFGVADEVWGQVVAALLVLEADADPRAVCQDAARDLASFKRPRLVGVVDALPLSPNGKLDRRALAARAAGRLVPVR